VPLADALVSFYAFCRALVLSREIKYTYIW